MSTILVVINLIIIFFAFANFLKIKNIKKSFENYLFVITTQKSYFIVTMIASFLIFIIAFLQTYNKLDFNVAIILLFFFSVFLLSLSHFIYYNKVFEVCKDYKEFFKDFEINLDNKCEKLMLKYIYSKEKDLNKIKSIFKTNKEICKD